MTPCPTEDVLLDYTAGRLNGTQTAILARHAQECARCAARQAAQLAIWRELDAWKPAPVSEGFNRELWRKIDADAESRSGSFAGGLSVMELWKRMAPLVFAVGIVVAAFVMDHTARITDETTMSAAARIVVTANDADQLESTLDDIQLLHDVDSEAAAVAPVTAYKKTL